MFDLLNYGACWGHNEGHYSQNFTVTVVCSAKYYKYFIDTCANVVLSCSCRELNTFCTDGTTALLTSALRALSNFPDRVVVSVCDRVL